MSEIFPQKEFWKLYDQLPKELQQVIISKETNDSIWQVCEKNELDVDIALFNRLVANVLMGLVPPTEFQDIIKKELGLKPDIAKKVSFEIYRYIFYPVRQSLSALYQMEVKAPIEATTREERPREEKIVKKRIKKEDRYREAVE